SSGSMPNTGSTTGMLASAWTWSPPGKATKPSAATVCTAAPSRPTNRTAAAAADQRQIADKRLRGGVCDACTLASTPPSPPPPAAAGRRPPRPRAPRLNRPPLGQLLRTARTLGRMPFEAERFVGLEPAGAIESQVIAKPIVIGHGKLPQAFFSPKGASYAS